MVQLHVKHTVLSTLPSCLTSCDTCRERCNCHLQTASMSSSVCTYIHAQKTLLPCWTSQENGWVGSHTHHKRQQQVTHTSMPTSVAMHRKHRDTNHSHASASLCHWRTWSQLRLGGCLVTRQTLWQRLWPQPHLASTCSSAPHDGQLPALIRDLPVVALAAHSWLGAIAGLALWLRESMSPLI